VADDRVDQARHGGAVEDVALEAGAADHGARRDGRGGVGEGELEQEEGEERHLRVEQAAVVVGRRGAVQEEVLVADDAVAQTELEGEPDRPVQEAAEAGVEHALQQHVDRFPGAGEARLEGHEAGLHEEDEERRDQHPGGVDRTDERVRRLGRRGQRCRADRRVEEVHEELHAREHPGDAEQLAREDHTEQPPGVPVLESMESERHGAQRRKQGLRNHSAAISC
jgi:hypothetical protein